MSLTSELEALATKETNLSSQSSSGKVANFSYTDDAYQADQYEGHSDFVAGRGNNIPLATSTSLKTNQTVLNSGYREQGASIVRHLANHFFGRVSYNLNKAHDNLLSLINHNIKTIEYTKRLFASPYLGRNWTLSAVQFPITSFSHIKFIDDLVVAYSSRYICKTSDMKHWDVAELPLTIDDVSDVYFNGNIWVVATTEKGLWWSNDLSNWNQGTLDGSNSIDTDSFNCVYYANNVWVAGSGSYFTEDWDEYGKGILWSEDGKDWTQSSDINSITDKVTYGNGIFVMSTFLSSGQSNPWKLKWSNDGKIWNNTSITNSLPTKGIFYVNNKWILTLNNNVEPFYYSDDGIVWSKATEQVGGDFDNVIYENGYYIATEDPYQGEKGTYTRSRDGKNWASVSFSSLVSHNIMSVRFINGVWRVFYDSGCMCSYDHVNWQTSDLDSSGLKYFFMVKDVWYAGKPTELFESSVDNLKDFPILDE